MDSHPGMRLDFLRRGQYNVLPLGQALKLLWAKQLPPRSVAITFDDGTFDFFSLGYPLLKKFGFPVTVYQTTYYTDRPIPVFNLVCSYLLWKRRGSVLDKGEELGLLYGSANRDPERFPAQLVAPVDGELHWFVDAAAAAHLDLPVS